MATALHSPVQIYYRNMAGRECFDHKYSYTDNNYEWITEGQPSGNHVRPTIHPPMWVHSKDTTLQTSANDRRVSSYPDILETLSFRTRIA